ncbi:cytochrome-c peroxidase [sulfur-oxidizing endosymbiont of Gigantopelta aegis]|uniref:cytochrome-c peroxidase n=1 Tax=sulfur-oxidizing endosymbiont of Gigantopelta aegis TaxID=2794934 RepID=UPI0018DC3FD4|nr:cytochrome c peroxidase [sulfur-oxidizing endosymbiont of Gigantopelta aegis]
MIKFKILTMEILSTISITLICLINSPVQAIESKTALNQALQHEPIQPIHAAEGLDKDKIALGEALFVDSRLSFDNTMACITCHALGDNGADHQALTPGRNSQQLDVNTPTVFNSSLNHQQFWDGRAQNLEDQINFVVDSKKEFASNWPLIISKLNQDNNYKTNFNKLYSDGITADNIRNAIAIFEQSLLTINSPFDRYLLGDASAISSDAKEGYRLFKDYGCVACHQGSNIGGNLFMKFGVFGDYFVKKGNNTRADLGRYNITGKASDRHVFRVPSLRLSVLTAPYFHDGSVDNLSDAIKIMAKHQLGRTISTQDIDYIIAFLKTLPGEYKGQALGATMRLQAQEKLK